ncbi:Homeodomain-like protein [Cynara cardunculus var. scolymus]|uniref:Homeodomain-like protein n=1 Tax=Cynara cardunculus var. scolymus TaxID=59895 RepID=A0A118JUJ2_CYNCS|nr:Homeodomain-like protein [Cynara cardunculus var. scolymus]
MPFDGISIEPQPSSNPLPDLSLQISPPDTSSVHTENTSQRDAYIDLSLPCSSRNLAPSLTVRDQYHPQNVFHHHPNHNHHRIYNQPPNNFVSLLDASKCLKPIKGIPVYHNRQFPFLPNLDGPREKEPKTMCLYPSSSSSSFPYFADGGNHMPFLNPMPRGSSSSGFSIPNCGGGGGIEARFSRLSSSYQLHHHNYGGGPTSHEVSHGMLRSKFLPKLPTKRSMRAPRMRWTSTLHSRFVHAVELLGGHERQSDDGSGEDDSSTMGNGKVGSFIDQRHPPDQQVFDHPNSSSATTTTTTLWSNSSSNGDAWSDANPIDLGRPSSTFLSPWTASRHFAEECDSLKLKSYLGFTVDQRNPSLEFTLGRPDWVQKEGD